MDLDPTEEEIILVARNDERSANEGKMDLATKVLCNVMEWDTASLEKAAQMIIWEINRRQKVY